MSEKEKQIEKPPKPPKSPKKKQKKPIKPITMKLTQRAALDWDLVRNYVSNRTGIRATNIDVAVELIRAFKDRKQLIEDLRVSESKLRKKDDEIFGLLRESINRPINIQVGALAQATTQTQQWIAPKPVHKIDGPKRNKLQEDLMDEVKRLCIAENSENGRILPSKIKEAVLLEVDEDD